MYGDMYAEYMCPFFSGDMHGDMYGDMCAEYVCPFFSGDMHGDMYAEYVSPFFSGICTVPDCIQYGG